MIELVYVKDTPWTAEEDRYLRQHHHEDADVIAQHLSRDPRSVRTRKHELRLTRRCAHNDGVVCTMYDCYGCGWNPATVAARKARIRAKMGAI